MTGVAIAGFDTPGRMRAGAGEAGRRLHLHRGGAHPQERQADHAVLPRRLLEAPANPAIQIFDPGVPFGVPFAPTPFRVTFHVKAGDVEVTKELPVEFRYVKDLYFGDKRMELNVVPAFSVRVTPELAVIPVADGARRETRRARDPRFGDQRHEGRGAGQRGAGAAGGMEGHSRQRAARLRARGRVAFGALPSHRAGAGEDRRVHACARW